MEKKNYGIVILVAILFLIIGGVGIYFIMNNSNDKEPVVDNNQEDNDDSNSSVKYEDWMDYILKSDIKSVKLNYCDYIDGELSETKTIQINKNDLNRVFEKVRKGTLTKNYGGGFGSPCNEGLIINYVSNNNEYELEMIYNHLVSNDVKDKMLLSLVEQSEYEISKDSEYDENDYTYVYSYDMDIIDTIIDEYTK